MSGWGSDNSEISLPVDRLRCAVQEVVGVDGKNKIKEIKHTNNKIMFCFFL